MGGAYEDRADLSLHLPKWSALEEEGCRGSSQEDRQDFRLVSPSLSVVNGVWDGSRFP